MRRETPQQLHHIDAYRVKPRYIDAVEITLTNESTTSSKPKSTNSV